MATSELIGILISLLGGGGIIGFITNFLKKRITYKKIKSKNDKDIIPFIHLYQNVIDEHIRIRSEELIKFINRPVLDGLDDNLLIWKKAGKIVSFVKFIYLEDIDAVFLAYFGYDKTDNEIRQISSEFMVNDFLVYIKKKYKRCKYVFFEAESHRTSILLKQKKQYGLLKLFKMMIAKMGMDLYEIDFDYLQPEMPDIYDGFVREVPMSLAFIPIRFEKKYIHKDDLLKLLEILYLKIYSRTYENDEFYELYLDYLREILIKYEGRLASVIKLNA